MVDFAYAKFTYDAIPLGLSNTLEELLLLLFCPLKLYSVNKKYCISGIFEKLNYVNEVALKSSYLMYQK